jgi:uncharacterized protein (TIGR02271 family)
MPLHRLENFDPNYRQTFEGEDIKGLGVYTEGSEQKVGSVSDVLVDDEGHFRYIIVDLGFWIFGKKVLLPIGRSQIDYNAQRVYVVGLTREQAEQLPEYKEGTTPDYDYEERVRSVYRAPAAGMAPPTYNRDTYSYQNEPSLYNMNEGDHKTFKLYEERLIANKSRFKTGEVAVGKRVETETATVSVPIEKERVVIERVTPADAGTVVVPGAVNFGEGEVARMEVYEETPDIHKEAVVREEVRVRKVVEQDTVNAEETLRKEQLDVKTEGQPGLHEPNARPSDRI